MADRDWTRADTERQLALTALMVADMGQTLGLAQHYDDPVNPTYEQNPILGKHPNREAVEGYFAVSALVALGIAYALPEKYRAPFQKFYIGYESAITMRNLGIGVQMKF